MLSNKSILSRLNNLDLLLNKDENRDVMIVIKDVGDNDYYYIDKEGNKIPTSQVIVENSIINSRGKTIPPYLVKVEIVDNSDLESVLYDANK